MEKKIIIENLLAKYPIDEADCCILSHYSEIKKILNIFDNNNLIKFCYFNRKRIYLILYEESKEITFDKPNRLSYLIYFILLIKYNFEIVDYDYNFKLINDLNN